MSFNKFLFSLSKTPLGDYIVGFVFESLTPLLPVRKIYENDKVIAFWHPKPFWEKHILIVPKRRIKSMTSLTPEDFPYIEEVYKVVKVIVSDQGFEGYTLLTNGGDRQEVNQIHFHLSSGPALK